MTDNQLYASFSDSDKPIITLVTDTKPALGSEASFIINPGSELDFTQNHARKKRSYHDNDDYQQSCSEAKVLKTESEFSNNIPKNDKLINFDVEVDQIVCKQENYCPANNVSSDLDFSFPSTSRYKLSPTSAEIMEGTVGISIENDTSKFSQSEINPCDINILKLLKNSVPDSEQKNSSLSHGVMQTMEQKSPEKDFVEPPINEQRNNDIIADLIGQYNIAEKAQVKAQCPGTVGINENEINEIIEGLDEDINSMLEKTAERNQLTATNVRSILRHVITNEYVLAMVRNTMKLDGNDEDDLEEAVFEPKLTRSKAKELREKQASLPWPVSSPAKQNRKHITKKLLEEDFSEEDNSSDEEYQPNEEEVECHSEEEDNTSSKGSNVGSPSSKALHSSPEKAESWDLSPLVIVEPDAQVAGNEENDGIALRTRSKLPLVDTPLETIEASFVAPDITVDMYDTECDDEDWQHFLLEFTKPLDEKTSLELADDDGEDDPEYNILEEEEDIHDDDDKRTVEISQKELNALMAEILETAEQELNDIEDDEEEDTLRNKSANGGAHQPVIVPQPEEVIEKCCSDVSLTWFTSFERLQLEEQMRMHVQLLTQSYVLSHGIDKILAIKDSSELVLKELKMFAERNSTNGKRSYFYADNLDGALAIINSYKLDFVPTTNSSPKSLDKKPAIPHRAKEIIAHSKVFIYPHLLPVVGFRPYMDIKSKAIFTEAEDTLVALGLEQFSVLGDNPIKWIQTLLVPTKTEQQIKLRIKNARSCKFPHNPIKYFYSCGSMQSIVRSVRPYDPANVKPPRELPADVLPKWMLPFLFKYYPLAPAPPKPPKIAVVHPLSFKIPERRKYHRILPRLSYVSPIKKISPILKKYVQHRRIAPVLPFGTVPSSKPVGLAHKQVSRNIPIKPKPPPFMHADVLPVTVAPCFVEHPNFTTCTMTSAVTAPITAVVLQPEPTYITQTSQIEIPIEMPIPQPVTIVEPVEIVPIVSTADEKDSTVSQAAENIQNIQLVAPNSVVVEDVVVVPTGENLNVDEGKVPENETPHDLETCEEVDEEAVDDEQDLAALMAASSTICKKQHSAIKKKNKHQRDLESTLQLLAPDIMESDPKKEERENIFAQSYLLRVMEALKDEPEKCERFLKTLCSYEYSTRSPVQLYTEIQEILKDHPVLIDDFVGFLSPEQARDCGKFIQYTMLTRIRTFLRKMEVHFSQQPHHIQRILRTLSQLQNQADLTSSAVVSALQPLLRNQSHLLEEFLLLLPDAAPPESMMTDFEEITIPNSEGEQSSCDSFEEITIPEVNDPYGGKDCPCTCHSSSVDARMQNKSRHCVKCGTKFIDGRIYIQTGKVLKPAQVIYHNTSSPVSTSGGSVTSKSPVKVVTSKASSENVSSHLGPVANPCHDKPMEEVERRKEGKLTTSGMTNISENILGTISGNLPAEACSSTFPCDVIEDAVLPPVSSSRLNYSIPSDFSHLQEAFSSQAKSPVVFSSDAHSKSTKTVKFAVCEDANSNYTVNFSNVNISARKTHSESQASPKAGCSSLDRAGSSQHNLILNWTREQDKIILETCQKHGVNRESFALAAAAIVTKSVQQVERRFCELMRLLEQHLKAAKS